MTFQPCVGCDGHECDNGCAYPGAALRDDQRPARYGWVPGSYIRRCHDCKERFIGDYRAILCAPCAYMRPAPRQRGK